MHRTITAAILCTLALVASASAADEKRLKQCRAINSELDKLENQRSDGGSARQMDSWKRRIHQKQDEYSRLYCRQYRFQLNR